MLLVRYTSLSQIFFHGRTHQIKFHLEELQDNNRLENVERRQECVLQGGLKTAEKQGTKLFPLQRGSVS